MDKRCSEEPMGGRSENAGTQSLRASAHSGDAEAQFQLGFRSASRTDTFQNYPQALEWYAKAAEQNHPLAQYNLGIMYANGQGVQQNGPKASFWFDRAAQLGDSGAQHKLGMGYYDRSAHDQEGSAPESRIEACKWLILAAAHGYADSEDARNQVPLQMTREDLIEATQRVTNFMISLRQNSSHPSSLQ